MSLMTEQHSMRNPRAVLKIAGLPSRRVGAVVLFDLFLNEAVPAFDWTPFGKHHHHDDEH